MNTKDRIEEDMYLAEEKGRTVTVKSRDRANILREAYRIKTEIAQIFADADYWNINHPNEEPINPDPDGALRRLADGVDRTLAG